MLEEKSTKNKLRKMSRKCKRLRKMIKHMKKQLKETNKDRKPEKKLTITGEATNSLVLDGSNFKSSLLCVVSFPLFLLHNISFLLHSMCLVLKP